MEVTMISDRMKKGLMASFMVALMLVTVCSASLSANAVTLNEETVSTKTEREMYFEVTFLFGKIKDKSSGLYCECWDAVDLGILVLKPRPIRYYHFNSSEEICREILGGGYFGYWTDNYLFAICFYVLI